VTTRTCSSCRQTDESTPFYPSYRTQCKRCLTAKAALKRDHRIAYLKAWRAAHPNAHKEWYAQNRGTRAADWQRWYAANRERRKVSYDEWARRNKPIVNATIARRIAAKKRAAVAWANRSAIEEMYATAYRLTTETGVQHDVDHIYPLQSDWVCGLHCEANLQVLTHAENLRKKNNRCQVAA
jgi:hypothetical protein